MATIEQPPQYQPYGQQYRPAPTNGLAVAALVLGIVALVVSPIPILNQAGILAGLAGFGLGIAGLIIGVRRHSRVVMAGIGVGLSVLGIIASVAFTNMITRSFTEGFNSGLSGGAVSAPAAPVSPASPQPQAADSADPVAKTYTLRVEGSAKNARVNFSVDGSSGGGQSVAVPWTKTMTSTRDFSSAMVSAYSGPGSKGDLKCSITDETGEVIAEQTAASQGGQFGSASVSCFGY